MKLSQFHYHLPEHLIARYPSAERSASRLLCLNADNGRTDHRIFRDLPELLREDDLLVFNDTRVIPARLFGRKATGGKLEVLIERVLEGNEVLAQIRASKSPKAGSEIFLGGEAGTGAEVAVTVLGRDGDFFRLRFPLETDLALLLAEIGHMPLPPYIDREDQALDQERYQTVYARQAGAVAAPTAGLHFDEALMSTLGKRGIDTAFVTLHVGAGTYQPVRADDIEDHQMHRELIEVSEEVCEKVRRCKARGGRVIAVGTTSVRSLESAAMEGELAPCRGETDIFIYPGYEFRVVDAIVTNFHLPESTLLMLVSAYTGDLKMLLGAYQEAIKQSYRFFSYGDAMFLFREPQVA